MCNSPSANYYKPTDEPEPWDLTQLNIEASVMCLVSKVKFLCGRCSSPAVRIRNKNDIDRNQCLKNYQENNRTNSTAVVIIQPKMGIKNEDSSKPLNNRIQQCNTSSDKQNSAIDITEEGMLGIIFLYFVNKIFYK
jgi:inositol polyphosphate-4-phosphatase